MRRVVPAVLFAMLFPIASAPAGPAIVDVALGDQDGAIYVDPALTLGKTGDLRPHAGDVNGDGIIDIITSHPESQWAGTDYRGIAWVALGPVLGLDRVLVARPPEVLFAGSASPPGSSGQVLGDALRVADFNGDGKDDIAIWQRGGDPRCPFSACSSLSLYFGASLPSFIDPLVQLPDVRIIGGMEHAIGEVWATDLDRDGIADLLIQSETFGDPSISGSGVIYGRSTWPPIIDLFTTSWDTDLPLVNGGGIQAEFPGMGAADLNGDGHLDLLAGDPKVSTVIIRGGELMVWFGSGGRFPASLSGVAPDVVFAGDAEWGLVGLVFATGDFDGDGVDDLAFATASAVSPSPLRDVFVFYGRATWPARLVVATDADLKLRAVATDYGGSQRLTFGDFDGDGRSDLAYALAGWSDDPIQWAKGRVYLWLGLPRVTGDVPMDAYPRLVSVLGKDKQDYLGGSSALLLHDLDRDGRSDLLVGAAGGDGPNDIYAPDSPGDLLFVRGCEWNSCCDLHRDATVRSIRPLDRAKADILPLDGDDCHRWRHVSGEPDPEVAVLLDATRPLVVYSSPRTTNELYLTRGPGDRVQVWH